MSYCAVNMQKRTMTDLGGIQSHNQREHESRKNREIDYSKSHLNYDLVHGENVNYHQLVKERIDALNLKRAVRKDAVVYCSFIVGSDREFFDSLARKEHLRREMKKESVAIGIRPPSDFDYCQEEYREECRRDAAERYFRDATEFFQRRFGTENVVNATVHHDEPQGALHMHLGLVPVTKDGRLSAKSLFTPETLRSLQTDFAAEVGEKYGLERGREGSDVKHLDEVTFKIQKRKEELESISEELREARWELEQAPKRVQEVESRVEALRAEETALTASVSDLKGKQAELSSTLGETRAEISNAHEELAVVQEAIKRTDTAGERQFGKTQWRKNIAEAREQRERSLMERIKERFLELPQIKRLWEQFLQMEREKERQKRRMEEKAERDDR